MLKIGGLRELAALAALAVLLPAYAGDSRTPTPVVDGVISPGEWDDAVAFQSGGWWIPQFSPTIDERTATRPPRRRYASVSSRRKSSGRAEASYVSDSAARTRKSSRGLPGRASPFSSNVPCSSTSTTLM